MSAFSSFSGQEREPISASPLSEIDFRLLQVAVNVGPETFEAGTHGCQGNNASNGNESGNQAIFNSGSAGFIFEEITKCSHINLLIFAKSDNVSPGTFLFSVSSSDEYKNRGQSDIVL